MKWAYLAVLLCFMSIAFAIKKEINSMLLFRDLIHLTTFLSVFLLLKAIVISDLLPYSGGRKYVIDALNVSYLLVLCSLSAK